MLRLRTFLVGVAGGIVGAAALVLVLFLLGVTDVTRTEQVTVSTPTTYGTPTSGGLSPAQIYEQAAKGVVEIYSTFSPSGTDPFGNPQGGGEGLGTGFVASKDGYILTNAHVVAQSGARATRVSVAFRSGENSVKRVDAEIVGVDDSSDVAVLKVNPDGLDLHSLPLGDSEKLKVGEPVVAIGNPLGFEFSLSAGVISALDRELQAPNNATIPNGIQTDAAINQGNSGGPLINAAGEVIGINEQIASQSGGNEGLGFAVPINTAKRSMDELKKSGKVAYAYLGIGMQTLSPDVAQALHLDVSEGVIVAEVKSGTPADKAGLRAGTRTVNIQGQDYTVGGDVITALDGTKTASMQDLLATIAAHKPRDEVTLTIVRDGKSQDVKVTLAERPANLQ